MCFVFGFDISIVFVLCLFGRLATESFDQLQNYLFESDWRNLPLNLQKDYFLMLVNAQRSLHYHGFGIVNLNLETFTKVSGAKAKVYL